MSLVAAVEESTPTVLSSLELSRSVKENHGTRIKQIATANSNSSFSNLVAVLSSTQVNIYDTDNLGQGHMDLLSHYHTSSETEEFIDCCWLSNENDGYLAILLNTGSIELFSLSYSAIISSIALPSSMKISKLFADLTDGERLFGVDLVSDTLHIFSFDSSVESPLIDCQTLDNSSIYERCGQLIEITKDRLKMRPLMSDDFDEEEIIDGPLLEISEGGKIEFASVRKIHIKDTEYQNDYFIIDQIGRIFFLHTDTTTKISSSLWSKRSQVVHDGDNLILILSKDGHLALFDLELKDFSVVRGALKASSNSENAICTFISPSDCCSKGPVRRVLIGDDTGTLNIYRIVP